MDTYWVYNGLEANPLYSCRNVTEVLPLHRPVPNVPLGIFYIFMGSIFQIAYIFSLTVIGRRENIQYSAYKIMFTLGCVDSLDLITCAHFNGYFTAIGAMFCDFPNLIYCLGLSANLFYNVSCFLCVFLIINRLLDVADSTWRDFFFKGKKTLFFILLSFLIGSRFYLFEHPVIFNADYGSWIFHPMIPGNIDHEYIVNTQTVANIFVSSSLLISCVLIYVLQWRKERIYRLKMVSYKKKILQQAILVCLCTFTTALIWAILAFLPQNAFMMTLMHVGHVSWILMHSMPALIYLLFNETIRSRVFKMIGLKGETNRIYQTPPGGTNEKRDSDIHIEIPNLKPNLEDSR